MAKKTKPEAVVLSPKIKKISADTVREYFDYNPHTGQLRWRKRPYKTSVNVGAIAGSVNNKTGYRHISLLGCRMLGAHNVAWLHYHGCHPRMLLDHKNGCRDDNRIENLREATISQNNANRRCHNRYGIKGVRLIRGSWVAVGKKDGIPHYFGSFKTPDEAHRAYAAGISKLHGEFARAV